MNEPDSWKIVKFTSPKYGEVYKLLAGWYGGYAYGDSWRLNSGIKEVIETDTHYNFIGASGSIYSCSKLAEHISGIMSAELSSWMENVSTIPDTFIEVIDYKDYNG